MFPAHAGSRSSALHFYINLDINETLQNSDIIRPIAMDKDDSLLRNPHFQRNLGSYLTYHND